MSGSRAGGAPRNHLSWELLVQVTDYVRANYAASKLDESEFAEQTARVLGFPVTVANIFGARKALKIESNYRLKAAALKQQREDRKQQRVEKNAVPVKSEGLNLVLDEIHALNQGLIVLMRKMDILLRAAGH
jgi:hypothetical protein